MIWFGIHQVWSSVGVGLEDNQGSSQPAALMQCPRPSGEILHRIEEWLMHIFCRIENWNECCHWFENCKCKCNIGGSQKYSSLRISIYTLKTFIFSLPMKRNLHKCKCERKRYFFMFNFFSIEIRLEIAPVFYFFLRFSIIRRLKLYAYHHLHTMRLLENY